MDDLNLEPGDDLLCIACGYDLRELPREGVCPECGLAVSRSENSDQLGRADPRWLALVARGLGFYVAGHLSIVIAVLSFMGFFFFSLVFSAAINPGWLSVLMIVCGATAVVGLFLMGIGTYLLAWPDPGRKEEPKDRRVRLLARFAIPAFIFYWAVLFSTDLLPPSVFRGMVVDFSIKFQIVWGGFAVVMVMLYSVRLIERIPMGPLQKYMNKAARFLLWAVPVFVATSWIQQVWSPAGVGSNFGVTSLLFGLSCISSLLGIFLLGTFIHQGLMMIRFRRAVCSCRDIAMQLNDNLGAGDTVSNDGD